MALTRSNAEGVIVSRLAQLMTAAGLATTTAGSNSDLDDPLVWAARRLGISPVSPVTVTDADLSGLDSADYDDFLDLVEFRTLENIQGNLALVDTTAGPRTEKLSQLTEKVEVMIEARRERAMQIANLPEYHHITLDIAADE